jgi:adenylate cyclase class IV
VLEVELKSVVDDVVRRRQALERAGGVLSYAGHLLDKRYDTRDFTLAARDEVLRVRIYGTAGHSRAELDWKGPTRREGGYKLREELATQVTSPDELVTMLARLGFVVTIAIDREIAQYDLGGAMIRFERYPRMDDLVEVEGAPEQIERAIAALGLPRGGFTDERLPDIVRRFEARTGTNAVLSDDELRGGAHYDAANA